MGSRVEGSGAIYFYNKYPYDGSGSIGSRVEGLEAIYPYSKYSSYVA